MKTRIISIILSAMLLIGLLTACGSSEPDPNAGVYKLENLAGFGVEEYAELMDMEVDAARDSFVVELKNGGKMTMTIDGEANDLKWSVDGETITISDGTETIEGTLVDGTMTLDFDGDELVLVKTN